MEVSTVTFLVLQFALGTIMLGLGLSLSLADFKRVAEYPWAVAVGLGCQMILLPPIAAMIAVLCDLPPEMAVGLMLLAASPGGPTANLYSHLAGGDVALNITLTALNSVLSLVTVPLLVNVSLQAFMGHGQFVPLPFSKILQIVFIVLVPVASGMGLRSRYPSLAQRLEKPLKGLSLLLLLLVILAAGLKNREELVRYFPQVGLAVLFFNGASMGIGYFLPRLLGIAQRQAIAIGMEISIHNAALAITIAASPTLLNNSAMSIPPALYSFLMYLTAALFGFLIKKR